jgi:hypothetical protein
VLNTSASAISVLVFSAKKRFWRAIYAVKITLAPLKDAKISRELARNRNSAKSMPALSVWKTIWQVFTASPYPVFSDNLELCTALRLDVDN